jgi:hypothetical protein
MTPRPLHRRKTLWLGIFVLIFLSWAWARSREHSEIVGFRPGGNTWFGIVNSGGQLLLRIVSYQSGIRSTTKFIDCSFMRIHTDPWFASPFKWDYEANAPSGPIFLSAGIAHWLIILLFLVPWLALLTSRSRRMKRLPTGSAEPERRESNPGPLI